MLQTKSLDDLSCRLFVIPFDRLQEGLREDVHDITLEF